MDNRLSIETKNNKKFYVVKDFKQVLAKVIEDNIARLDKKFSNSRES